jgi:hypothetical protein
LEEVICLEVISFIQEELYYWSDGSCKQARSILIANINKHIIIYLSFIIYEKTYTLLETLQYIVNARLLRLKNMFGGRYSLVLERDFLSMKADLPEGFLMNCRKIRISFTL